MQPKDRPFPPYARHYFAQLQEQYELVLDHSGQTAPKPVQALIQKAQANPADVSWSDVFALETAYLYAIPDSDPERLREELKIARDRYRDVVGVDEFATYMRTVPADVTKLSVAETRAEILALAERLRYLYTFVPPKEDVRNKIAMDAAIYTIVAGIIGLAVYMLTEFVLHTTLFTIVIVLFVGEMGGFVSVQQRLNAGTNVDPLFKELQLTYGWFSVVVIAPMTGAIFAIVLYFLFVGGLMSGGLFPSFGRAPLPSPEPGIAATPAPSATPSPTPVPCAPGDASCAPSATLACARDPHCPPNVTLFLERATPRTIEDWGKLLAWAFIAGFAERFVPDVLTRLTGGQYSVGGDKPPSSVPVGASNGGGGGSTRGGGSGGSGGGSGGGGGDGAEPKPVEPKPGDPEPDETARPGDGKNDD